MSTGCLSRSRSSGEDSGEGKCGPWGGGGSALRLGASRRAQAHLARHHFHNHAQALWDDQDVTEDDGAIQLWIPLHRLGEGEGKGGGEGSLAHR